MPVTIRRAGAEDAGIILAAATLFDDPPDPATTRKFLSESRHHLLFAFADDGRPVGFVSGVELVHPDKGTEMLLYELSVDEPHRRHGVGRALVEALAALARDRRCHGMFVLVDDDNAGARATYARAGGTETSRPVMIDWDLTGLTASPSPAEPR